MSDISYVDGRYLPHAYATVHMEDRGYQFADGVYEVIAFFNRKLLDEDLHLKRLARSLSELSMAEPMSMRALSLVMEEVIARNSLQDGFIYLQVTRGVSPRNHPFPTAIRPVLTMSVAPPKTPSRVLIEKGVEVITTPDIRWSRRDIKSIALLPNILCRQRSVEAGVRESWLVDDRGMITEGSLSNAYIVSAKGEIVTHPSDHNILGGVTRDVVLSLARKNKIPVVERPFTLKEVAAASEAFLTSSTSNVLPVVIMDGKKIGKGQPGPITLRLLDLYLAHIRRETGKDLS